MFPLSQDRDKKEGRDAVNAVIDELDKIMDANIDERRDVTDGEMRELLRKRRVLMSFFAEPLRRFKKILCRILATVMGTKQEVRSKAGIVWVGGRVLSWEGPRSAGRTP